MNGASAVRLHGFFRYHLRDMVYGAFDGAVTTFAVVAGVQGAGLPAAIILILGTANLIADGISMALGNFTGTQAENEARALAPEAAPEGPGRNPATAAAMTFAAFVVAGIVPLLPFIAGLEDAWTIAILATGCAFFAIGALKSIFTAQHWYWAGAQTLAIGAIAAGAAWLAGRLVGHIV